MPAPHCRAKKYGQGAHAGGFFARDASVLRSVGSVLLDQSTRSTRTLKRWLVGTDAFEFAETDSKQALYQVPIPNSSAEVRGDLAQCLATLLGIGSR